MKICIYGAGSIGGLLAHGMAQVKGIELSIIVRGAHLAAIRANGLAVIRDGKSTSVKIMATSSPADLGPQDIVFNCLKAHQAWESAADMVPLLKPDTPVVTCQNGIPWWYFYKLPGAFEGSRLDAVDRNNRQWDIIGPQRAIGCSVYPAAEISEPGVITHVFGDKFALGEPDGSISKRIQQLSEIVEKGGFRAPVLDDIRSELWLKLWGNLCFNPISALTGATLDIVASHPTSRATAKSMMLEAQEIAEALGAHFRVDVELRIDGAAKVGAHRTSMLQDFQAKKPMEIDALVSVIQEMGKITGKPTPVVDVVLGLVRQLAMTHGLYPTYPEETSSG